MKEFKYFIDSNIFLRTLVKDDEERFRDCVNFLKEVRGGKLRVCTSNLILAEINWTLLKFYEFPKKAATKGLGSILSLKNLKIFDNFDPILALELYKNYPIKFIDCLIASNPKIFNRKAILVSYDKDFDKLKVKRVEPSDLLKK